MLSQENLLFEFILDFESDNMTDNSQDDVRLEETEAKNDLERVEAADTVDTTDVDAVKTFIDKVRAVNVGEGAAFWKLLSTLPVITTVMGKSLVLTKCIKYLNAKKLMPAGMNGTIYCCSCVYSVLIDV